MNEEEMVALYCHLSSLYLEIDNPLKEMLPRLEKELFSSLTISQIESLQNTEKSR
ncbi:MAG: hypothetical protein PQJ50_06360 [Spirochaetales bacterium]|nr:hypothetical protein [Spirochaetales bacterium]